MMFVANPIVILIKIWRHKSQQSESILKQLELKKGNLIIK